MKHLYFTVALSVGAGLFCGCGSSSNSTTQGLGSALFSIRWPERSRLIPMATNSIKVDIANGAIPVASQVVDRPAQGGEATVQFDNLPVGNLTATATAYPEASATGTPQAQGSVSLPIQAGQTTYFTITMASTIDHLEITPADPSVEVNQSLQLTATPKDVAGNVVLVAPGNISWTSANPAVVAVDSEGKVTGIAVGNSQVTATESESGKSASVSVTVTVQQSDWELRNTGVDQSQMIWTVSVPTANVVWLGGDKQSYSTIYRIH